MQTHYSKQPKIWGSRRRFLKDIVRASVSATFVNTALSASGLLWARSVFAQDGDVPLRYILCFTPDGCGARESTWHADTTGRQFNLNESSANFEPFKQRLVMMDGISGVGGHGDKKSFITGAAKQSIDSYLANTIGAAAPYPWTGVALAGQGLASRNAAGNSINPDTNPFSLYRRFFGTGEASATVDGLDLTSARYISVLNTHREMINDIKLKLGQAQRERFEAIENSIETTEAAIRRKAANQSGACSVPAWGGAGGNESALLSDGDVKADLLMEVIALALKCDMTRSVALSIDRSDTIPVVNAELHSSAHDGKTTAARDCRLWLNSKLIQLMTSLDNSIESNGQSVFYNSLLHHVTDYGNGKEHDNQRAAIFLAGNAKGRLDTGQAINGSAGAFFEVFDTVAQIAGVINRPDYPNYGGGKPMTPLIN